MFNRFALSLACTTLFLSSPFMMAQERDSTALSPVPDPTFSPELASSHRVKGKLLLDALSDIELSRQVAGQTAFEAREEAARLLAFNWNLKFDLDAKGRLLPGSSQFQPIAAQNTAGATDDKSTFRIPKGVVLLAMQIQQSQTGTIDWGQGSGHAGLTGDELDLICGPDWIITWLEDENGNMIEGTAELYCGGQSFPLPL